MLTTPWPLTIRHSKVSGAGVGVWTKWDLPPGLLFGPYEGRIHKDFAKSSYSWMISCAGGNHYVDANDPSLSNWLRYVNCGRNSFENNLMAIQYNRQIFYKTNRPILSGSELMVWYGDYYGRVLGIHRGSVTWQKNITEVKFSCYACHEIFGSEQQLFYHFDICSVASVNNENSRHECTKDVGSLALFHSNKPKKYNDGCCSFISKFGNFSNCSSRSHSSGLQNKPTKRKCNCDHDRVGLCGISSYSDGMEGKNKSVSQVILDMDDTERHKFVCCNCEKRFKHSSSLKRHKAAFIDKTSFTCQIDKKYSILKDLSIPNMLVTECANLEKAPTSAMENLDKMSLPNKPVISESRPIIASLLQNLTNFNCDNCSKTFDNVFALLQHDIEHSKSFPLQCGLCGWRFSTFMDLQGHIKLKHGEISKYYLTDEKEYEDGYCLRSMINCHQCDCTFDSYSNWTQITTLHFNEKHSQFIDLQKDIEWGVLATMEEGGSLPSSYHLNCPICYEQFNNMFELESHKYAHISFKMRKCRLCHVWIGSNLLLKEHLKYHQGNFEISNWFSVKGLPSECSIVLPNSIVYRLQWLLHKKDNINSQILLPLNRKIISDVEENMASKTYQNFEDKNEDCTLMLETEMHIKAQQPLIRILTVSDNEAGTTVPSKLIDNNDDFECDNSQSLLEVIAINNHKGDEVLEHNCTSSEGGNFLMDGISSERTAKECDESPINYIQVQCKETKLVECIEAKTISNDGRKDANCKEISDFSSHSVFKIISKGKFGATKFLLGTKAKAETNVTVGLKSEINIEIDASTNVKPASTQVVEADFDIKSCESDTVRDSCVTFSKKIAHVPDKEIDDHVNGSKMDVIPTAAANSEVKDLTLENKTRDSSKNIEEEGNIMAAGCGEGLEDLISHFRRFLEDDDFGNKENTVTIFPSDAHENEGYVQIVAVNKKPYLSSPINPNECSSNLLISDLNLTSIIENEKKILETSGYLLSIPPSKGMPLITPDSEQRNNSYLNVYANNSHKTISVSNLIAKLSCEDEKSLILDDIEIVNCNQMSNELANKGRNRYNLRKHSNLAFYSCKICGKNLEDFSLLSEHRRMHKTKLQLNCKHCEMKFKDHNKYLFHLTTHISFLSCNCGARFTNDSSLNRHQSFAGCLKTMN